MRTTSALLVLSGSGGVLVWSSVPPHAPVCQARFNRTSVLKQKRGELMQAPPPRQEFVRGVGRNVRVDVLEARGRERVAIFLQRLGAALGFAIADESHLYAAVELIRVGERTFLRFGIAQRAAAENPKVREHFEMPKTDAAGLRAAHGKARHSAMLPV